MALVNNIYPLPYFSLNGVDDIQFPDGSWWASRQRFASVDPNTDLYLSTDAGGQITSEILEVDLGRVREINYLNLDVLKVPVNIVIEYDMLSTNGRETSWQPVARKSNMPFDSYVAFDTTRVAWFNAEFNFTDALGNMVHTRYLRITFQRRIDRWPSANSAPFRWPVFVKHMRTGRTVSNLIDTVGPALNQTIDDIDNTLTELELPVKLGNVTRQVRQRFMLPEDIARGDVIPDLLGFGVLIKPENLAPEPLQDIDLRWNLWDVTDEDTPLFLASGIATQALTAAKTWVDVYLSDAEIVTGDLDKVYEFRIESNNLSLWDTVYTTQPNDLSLRTLPGTLSFIHGNTAINTTQDTTGSIAAGDFLIESTTPDQVYEVLSVTSGTITLTSTFLGTTISAGVGQRVFPLSTYSGGDYAKDATRHLVMRAWATVGDTGKDILGNTYRYLVQKEKASYVRDGTKAGWMSKPVPSPDAVEALYFDVRTHDEDGNLIGSQIDAMRISARTFGVFMNVYYSTQNVDGEAPIKLDEWDMLLWHPVAHEPYVLRKDMLLNLPNQIKAAFIKLEFTNLNPLPFRVPTFPPLPPASYRRFPNWVEEQFLNSATRRNIEDWFAQNATPVQIQILKTITGEVARFAYQQQELLAQLALGKVDGTTVNSQLIDVANQSVFDPNTASQIYVSNRNEYSNSLVLSVDQNSVLGRSVLARYNTVVAPIPTESTVGTIPNVPVVSTSNDRVSESYQNLATIPMRFNRTCRHDYIEEEAIFVKKAYFVGIDEVTFLRNDYTIPRDDTLILEELYNDDMLEENTWASEEDTTISDNTIVFVSYDVGLTHYTDEPVLLSGFNMATLLGTGGPARNIRVFAREGQQGIEYFQEYDYVLAFGRNTLDQRTNLIGRMALLERLTIPAQPIFYGDAGRIPIRLIIHTSPTEDAATITVVLHPGGDDALNAHTFGDGTFGGGTFGTLSGTKSDSATIDIDLTISGTESVGP